MVQERPLVPVCQAAEQQGLLFPQDAALCLHSRKHKPTLDNAWGFPCRIHSLTSLSGLGQALQSFGDTGGTASTHRRFHRAQGQKPRSPSRPANKRLLCHRHLPSIARTSQLFPPHLGTSFQPHTAATSGSSEPEQLIHAEIWCSISQTLASCPWYRKIWSISCRAAPSLGYRNPSAQALHGKFPHKLRFCTPFVQNNWRYKASEISAFNFMHKKFQKALKNWFYFEAKSSHAWS